MIKESSVYHNQYHKTQLVNECLVLLYALDRYFHKIWLYDDLKNKLDVSLCL